MQTTERVITSETLEARARRFSQEHNVPYEICIHVGIQFYIRHRYDIVRESELLGAAPATPDVGDPFESLRRKAA